MYCSSCQKEVDINSVSVEAGGARGAITTLGEDMLVPTVVSSKRSKIVNVCKSCGRSEFLWKSKEQMEALIAEAQLGRRAEEMNLTAECILEFADRKRKRKSEHEEWKEGRWGNKSTWGKVKFVAWWTALVGSILYLISYYLIELVIELVR